MLAYLTYFHDGAIHMPPSVFGEGWLKLGA